MFATMSFIICFIKSVQRRGFFRARSWTCLFTCYRSADCFRLKKDRFSTGSTTVKNHMEANVLVVWAPSS